MNPKHQFPKSSLQKTLLLGIGGIVAVGLSACSVSKREKPEKSNQSKNPGSPNVILCMADDMGWGDTGYNGHTEIQTPNLDEMASAGIQFNRFYSAAPVCSPTRGSCLTGRNPFRYGIYRANVGHLKEQEITLAEVFNTQGYATGHFGKWHLGTFSPEYSGKGDKRKPGKNYMTPTMAGFDKWFSTEYSIATYNPYKPENAHGSYDVRNLYWEDGINLKQGPQGDDSRIIMDKALSFIEQAALEEEPFFAVIWFHAPHEPVIGVPDIMEEHYSDHPEEKQHYYSVVTALDRQMGRLREKLRQLGVAKNTLLCFTSDNGPAVNPTKTGRRQGSAGPFRGRKGSLYEGGIRVPSIIEYPGRFVEHKEIDVPAITSDYFVTCCDLLGMDISNYNRPYDGISLLPVISGQQKERGKPIGFHFKSQKSLVGEKYKLVYNKSSDRRRSDNGEVPVSEYELYNLIRDPSETRNIIDKKPGISSHMKEKLWNWVESCERSDQGKDYPCP